jgi:hypothetical protein
VFLKLERGDDADALAAEPEQAGKRLSPQHHVEREMLKLLARSADVYEVFAPQLAPEYFDRAQHRKLLEIIRGCEGDIRAAVAQAEEDKLAGQLAALVTESVDGDPTESYAYRLLYRLQEFDYARRIDSLRKDLQPRNPMVDPQYDAMFAELSKLEGNRRRVREQAEQQ